MGGPPITEPNPQYPGEFPQGYAITTRPGLFKQMLYEAPDRIKNHGMNVFRLNGVGSFNATVRADGRGRASGGTIVGLRARNGVVVAADTRSSNGTVVASEDVQKIAQVHPSAVIGSTDDLGEVQSFVRTVRSKVDLYETERGKPMEMDALSTFAAGELRSHPQLNATFILGGVDNDGPHIFSLSRDDGALEDAYAAAGSGRQTAYGVLDAEVTDSLTLGEARRIIIRALRSAAERDVQTGGGVYLAEISEMGVSVDEYESFESLREAE